MSMTGMLIERMFLSVLSISITVSLMVGMMFICAPLFGKRYAVKWKYLIWIFLALRLVIPFDVEDVQYMAGRAMQKTAGDGWEAQRDQTEDADGSGPGQAEAAGTRFVLEIPGQAVQPLSLQSGKLTGKLTPLMVLEGIWLLGAGLFLAVHIGGYLHYKRQILRKGRPADDHFLLRQTDSLRRELQIKGKVRIVKCGSAASPMMIGFIRPVLVIPDLTCSPEELYFILKHELVHLRRHDVWWKLLFVAANAVHWFNPMIWIMHKEAIVDMELSCDERVMQGTDYAEKKAYTETLLSMLHKKSRNRSALTTQFYGGKQIMKRRFHNILRKSKGKNGVMILLGAAVLTVGLGVLVGCSVAGDGEEDGGTDVHAMVSGIVSDRVDVPVSVLDKAEELVGEWFANAQAGTAETDYWDWWIQSLYQCYTYEDFHGMELHVYQLNHRFLAGSPENVVLSGGMSIDEEGWVAPDYENSRFLIFRQEDGTLSYVTYLVENDCLPGDEVFNLDLEQQMQEMGMLEQGEENPNGSADTATLSYRMEGELEEETATLFVGSGYSIYVPDNWSLYAPDSWSYIFNEQIMFRVECFEGQSLEQVQTELAAAYGMSVDGQVQGKLEMAAKQEAYISRVRLFESEGDVWAVFYAYPEEAVEGAGACLPVIVDTFTVTGVSEDAQPWQSRPVRDSFWELAPETDFSTGNTVYFANGLQITLPEEWAGRIVIEVSYAPGVGNSSDTLAVCEERNAQAGVGGVLFYMHYIDKDYYGFSPDEPYQMFGEHVDRAYGIYERDGHEYALIFELPREMNYAEGNEEMQKAYEDMFASVGKVQVITDNMENFTPCGVDGIDWAVYMD